jgi:hypothetical protein
MASVGVIGAGYVGLTTAACLAHLGHVVRCSDVEARRVEQLSAGEVPIVEDGLAELVREGFAAGRLFFGTSNRWAVEEAGFTFLCVPTPQGTDGRADMSYIEEAAGEIGPHLRSESVVVNKSTVPVGSTKVVERSLRRPDVSVVSNPEFLREGSAVHDFLHPCKPHTSLAALDRHGIPPRHRRPDGLPGWTNCSRTHLLPIPPLAPYTKAVETNPALVGRPLDLWHRNPLDATVQKS